MKCTYFILVAVVASCSFVTAQEKRSPARVDTLKTDTVQRSPAVVAAEEEDEVESRESYSERFVPRKASLYAAVLPGAGQIYTKKYWKLPLVYGGFVALGIAVDFYNVRYRLLRQELFKTLEDPGYKSEFGTEQQLRAGVDSQRRDRDFYILMLGVLYLLQIADAHIDAHLKEFQLNPNLQVSIEPAVENSRYTGNTAGLALKLRF